MINILKPIDRITSVHNGVFLAGPCPRYGQNWMDWRTEFTDTLDKKGFNGDIINPTNDNYDKADPEYYDKQCTWETEGMKIASVIVFWIDRNDEHPAFTTNIEFGIWSNASTKRIIVGIPEGSQKCDYIKWVCKTKGIPCFSTMNEVADEVINALNAKPKVYFTSDTHFNSERTLKFSKRPFRNVYEMNYELISNWNKVATCNDTIYHLGDFGDFSIIPLLQFKSLVIIRGNYERDDNIESINHKSVYVVDGPISPKFDKNLLLVHEPLFSIDGYLGQSNNFYLYGHIHEKGKVKLNGLNVGIDANSYNLVDLDTIGFYKNAILNHYDDNVFTNEVRKS